MKKGISIDIGSDVIKIISYKKSKNNFIVKKSVSLNLPDCEIRDGMIVDVSAVAKVIKEAMTRNKIRGKNVNFTLSSNKVITREVNYPDLPVKKLKPVIKMNSAEYFPVNLEDYTMNYSVLERFEEELKKMVRTNTIVVPTEIVDSYVELAKKLKLKIDNITYAENAMMNYALLVNDPGPYMTVDIGGSRTSVAIVKEGKVVLNRTLSNGIKGIVDIVKEKYEVDYDRAVEIINENEFIVDNTSLQDTFTGKVIRIINLVISGIARLLDYYSSKHVEPVSTIYISGMGAYIKGLQEYMAKYFGIETKMLDNISTIKSKDSNYNKKKNIYANAIGAVYSDVNLLPESFLERKRSKESNRAIAAIIVLIIALGGAMLYIPFSESLKLKEEFNRLQSEKEGYDNVDDIIAKREQLKFRNTFLMELENAFSNDYKSVDILRELEKRTPKDIDYSIMKVNEKGVVISCTSNTKNSIANYLEEVKKIEIEGETVFADAFIPSITISEGESENKEKKYNFTISCDFMQQPALEETKEAKNEE